MPFPPDSGGRIKTYNLLRILAPHHEVYCHALVRDRKLLQHRENLTPFCRDVQLHYLPRTWTGDAVSFVSSHIMRRPFVVQRHVHRPVLERLRQAVREQAFDAVYCDHLSMLEYGRRLGLPIVLDAHNVEFEIIRRHARNLGRLPVRVLAEIEWRRVRAYERRWYPACRLIFSVSEVDAQTIRELAGDVPIAVEPISVDVAATPEVQALTPRAELLWIGGLHWPPNQDAVRFFIDDILPIIQRSVPEVRLTVVGQRFERLAAQLKTTTGIRFVGYVRDLNEFAATSRVLIVPLRSGSGMRVKILDGLARGLPIVTTSIGCEGIDVRHGVEVLIGNTASEFAARVVDLLRDEELAQSLRRAGRARVRAKYDISVIASTVETTLRAAVRPETIRHQMSDPPGP
jgi:glycosyltransferase involved in cell wall biosynthesis